MILLASSEFLFSSSRLSGHLFGHSRRCTFWFFSPFLLLPKRLAPISPSQEENLLNP
jgi:hypothetical protein